METRGVLSRLRQSLRSDRGIGMVEVIISLMVLSVIVIGMLYSLAAVSRLTKESSARETATNLAAAEIDRIQSVSDAFNVHSGTRTVPVDGVNYTVETTVGWVSTTGSTGNCGSGGGNLQYKAVNVEVSWVGMYLKTPVRADSAMAPDSRINDPSYGTILVSVLGSDGTGRNGVTVRVTPESGGGGVAITDPIDPTDADGCTYVLQVSPGNYKIEVEKSGYVDVFQVAVPSYTQQAVTAGSTTTASFTYENAGTFAFKYAATSTATPALPSNLDVVLYGGQSPLIKTTPPSSLKLHPFTGGYQVLAGNPVNCAANDPELWTASGAMLDGERVPAVAASPGGAATLPVGMGVVTVKIPSGSDQYITAVQQSTPVAAGNPGCATSKNYTFATKYTRGTTQTIALPYGTWKLYTSPNPGQLTTPVTGGSLGVLDGVISINPTTGALIPGVLGAIQVTGGDTVTLDPRVKQ